MQNIISPWCSSKNTPASTVNHYQQDNIFLLFKWKFIILGWLSVVISLVCKTMIKHFLVIVGCEHVYFVWALIWHDVFKICWFLMNNLNFATSWFSWSSQLCLFSATSKIVLRHPDLYGIMYTEEKMSLSWNGVSTSLTADVVLMEVNVRLSLKTVQM